MAHQARCGIDFEGLIDRRVVEVVRVVAEGLPGYEEHGFPNLGVGVTGVLESLDGFCFRVALGLEKREEEGAKCFKASIVQGSPCLQRDGGFFVEAE
jgi:hypothetical protein